MNKPPVWVLLEQVENPEEAVLDYRDIPEVKAVCEYALAMEEIVEWVSKSWPLRQLPKDESMADEARCFYCQEYGHGTYFKAYELNAFPHAKDCVWKKAKELCQSTTDKTG